MKITDILKQKEVTVSFELFPPKEGSELKSAHEIVKQISKLNPSFMSVTYGAGGNGSSNTVDIANEVQNINNITVLAHLTCISSDSEKIKTVLDDLKSKSIRNILALRGDFPKDCNCTSKSMLAREFKHACDLTEFIKQYDSFCVGGACYPEGHPESENLCRDIEGIKAKVASGCDFLTSQMFFDNNILYSYMFRLLKNGINVPIIAGIMPVTNKKQISRICQLSGTALPPRFKAIIDRFGDNQKAMQQAGIAYATEQIIDLIANGVNNIHIYTMNKPDIAASIMHNLSYIFN